MTCSRTSFPTCLTTSNDSSSSLAFAVFLIPDHTESLRMVKLAAKSLLHRFVEEQPKVLIQDWFRDGQSRRVVRNAVEHVLNRDLPDSYDRLLFREKCDTVFELMIDYAARGKKWTGLSNRA
jgi:hypothetical protein